MSQILVTQQLLDLIPEMVDAGFQVNDPIIIIGDEQPVERSEAQTNDDSGFVGTRPGHGRPIAG